MGTGERKVEGRSEPLGPEVAGSPAGQSMWPRLRPQRALLVPAFQRVPAGPGDPGASCLVRVGKTTRELQVLPSEFSSEEK